VLLLLVTVASGTDYRIREEFFWCEIQGKWVGIRRELTHPVRISTVCYHF